MIVPVTQQALNQVLNIKNFRDNTSLNFEDQYENQSSNQFNLDDRGMKNEAYAEESDEF
jgi:hypothetical protein